MATPAEELAAYKQQVSSSVATLTQLIDDVNTEYAALVQTITDLATFIATVTLPEDPKPEQGPTISAIADVTITENTTTDPIAFTISDPDTPPEQLVLMVASSDQTLVPNENIALAGSGTDHTLTITPATDTTGQSRITVTVTDGTLFDVGEFTLTVDAVPPPPPPPPTTPARIGVALDAGGRTLFQSTRTVTLRSDGTGDYRTVAEVQNAIAGNPAIDMVLVSGRVASGTNRITMRGQSAQRPIVFKGASSDATIDDFQSVVPFANLALVDLRLTGASSWLQSGTNVLVEGCRISKPNGGTGIVCQDGWKASPSPGPWKNLCVRFNVISDCFSGGKSQGMYLQGCEDMLLEYNVIDGCGWNRTQSRDSNTTPGYEQERSHGVYTAQPGKNAIVRYNVFSRNGSHGCQLRTSGELLGNICIRDPIALLFGYLYIADAGIDYGQITGVIKDNVAIGSDDIGGNRPRGMFLQLSHVNGVTIEHNAAVHNLTGSSNDVFVWFDKGAFANVRVERNIAAQWASQPYRNLPGSGVTQSGNRLNLSMSDLKNPTKIVTYEQDSYIDSLVASGFANQRAYHSLLEEVWGCIE